MSDIQIRPGTKRFFDNKKFPRGFAKSGDFTLTEEDLLIQYGDTLQALELGELEPSNQEENHFLKVLEAPTKAKSKLERTWLKYVKLSRGRRKFHTLNGKHKTDVAEEVSSSTEELDDDTPEIESSVETD